MTNNVRVRFAPSPTGGLHLGGMRTVLYNYLFAKKHGGKFILRIEDTDQTRFVEGAEQYIFDCLDWSGLTPDESTIHGGEFGPYRQSERKPMYKQYAEQLIAAGQAYIAFDTPAEIEKMRTDFKTTENPSPQYDRNTRSSMRNSLTLTKAETDELIAANTPFVIRILMPENEIISFTDLIRGEVNFNSGLSDDKVLLKADGMPTYHLAVVVDDYLMQISHAFRGEEWLPSAPVHVLLWKYLFGLENMPQWAHLPLILGPNGKLSKRDGAKYGFPVFAKNWTDPKNNELTEGFMERGFLPDAFNNLLALLGWNNGTEKELFTMAELIENFSLERVHISGAKFDYEKAKWFNHEWLKTSTALDLLPAVKKEFAIKELIITNDDLLIKVIDLVKERCHLLPDFYTQGSFFFEAPKTYDLEAVKPKWTDAKTDFFNSFVEKLKDIEFADAFGLENTFKELATEKNIKPGELQLPLRIMIVGGKFGPPVFEIAVMIGKEETVSRIEKMLNEL